MRRLNTIGLDTRHGFRTVDLLVGDLAALDPPADIVVLSAFAGDYVAVPGSVIGALSARHGINVSDLAMRPAIDLRTSLSVWLSDEIKRGPAPRLLCVELIGARLAAAEILENVFASLLLVDAKGIPVRRVAMPLLGTGYQQFRAEEIAEVLVTSSHAYLERSYSTEQLQFVEINEAKAAVISEAMDVQLGRARVALPQEQLVNALREEILNRLHEASDLFGSDGQNAWQEWILLMQQSEVRSAELGVAGRKLVEAMLTRLAIPQQPLSMRIRALENSKLVAPWICNYMHLLRHLGNESAHETIPGTRRRPSAVAPADLTAALFCVKRLLEFWITERPHLPTA